MAIVSMSKVTLAVPARMGGKAVRVIRDLGILHPRRIGKRNAPVSDENELKLERARKALDGLDKLFPEKLPFVANFAWPKPRINEDEYDRLVGRINLTEFSDDLLELTKRLDKISDRRAKLGSEKQLLTRYAFLPIPIDIPETQNVMFILGQIPRRNMPKVMALNKSADCAISRYGQNVILISCMKSVSPDIQSKLAKLGFESLPLPKSKKTPSEQIEDIDIQLDKLQDEKDKVLKNIEENFLSKRTALLANIDSLEMIIEAERVRGLAHDSEHSALFIGYIPTNNADEFATRFKGQFPDGYIEIQDVPKTEEPPVELTNNKYSTQFEMLTSMYGLPRYRSLDSTFILSIIFPIFFGICFGDVLYGLMLMGISLWFGRLYKHDRSAKKFFGTFLISSVFVTVIGALTGAWGGNMIGTIITWQPLINLRDMLMVIDPIKETIPFFILTLYIGIGTQFLGIAYKGWMQIKAGEWVDAVTDSGGWLIFLSGLTLFAVDFLSKTGLTSPAKTLMYVLIGAGALLLIFSQGKDAKSIPGRIGVGITSLYGVLGGYGTTGFLSDVMSYSRLLALGLTTSIVAQAFNSIAEMMGLSGIGLIFAILILFVGHLFNFFLNIVGSFVHPVRLVFLEFYTRFYESGGGKYRPFSREGHTRINVVTKTDEGEKVLQEAI